MSLLVDALLIKKRLGNCKIYLLPARAGSPLMRLAVVVGVAGILLSGAYFGGASAQSRVATNGGAELQTLYATPEEIAQGKVLVDSTCSTCHGANGISATPNIPSLAGQRSAYLFLELKAYQAGARGDNPM